MENSSYKIYLTESHDAAELIAEGLKAATPWTREGGETISIICGSANSSSFVPAIYQHRGLFYAVIEYRNGDDWSHPKYEVILC